MITLTHATTGHIAEIFKHKIFGFSYSTQLAATLVYADGGAVIPVKESLEQLRALLTEVEKTHSQEK